MKKLLTALALLLAASQANATVIFDILRVSDTVAVLTGSGTLDQVPVPGNGHILSLGNPFDVAPGVFANSAIYTASTLQVGGRVIQFAYDAGQNYGGSPFAYFGSGSEYAPGDTVTGSITLTLTGGDTWANAGSAGVVFWGIYSSFPTAIGSWTIHDETPTAVSEPSSFALFALAAAAIMFVRRRVARS